MRIGANHIKLVWTNSHLLRSHFLITESEFVYGLCRSYGVGMWQYEVYVIYDVIMKLSCTIALFLSQSCMWCNNSMNFALKLCIPSSRDDNTDCATRPQHVQSLVIHGIIDNAHSVWKQTMWINSLPMHITFIVWTHL